MATITFTIQDANYDKFKRAFLKENPAPSDFNLGVDEWVKEWGRRQYLSAMERGEYRLAEESVIIDRSIIT